MVSKRNVKLNKRVMKVILKGKSNGLKWREICKEVRSKFGVYISVSALQQRYQYFRLKNEEVPAKKAKSFTKSEPTTVVVENYDGKVSEFQGYVDSYIAQKVTNAKDEMKSNLKVAIDNLVSIMDSSVKHFTNNIKKELMEALDRLE